MVDSFLSKCWPNYAQLLWNEHFSCLFFAYFYACLHEYEDEWGDAEGEVVGFLVWWWWW